MTSNKKLVAMILIVLVLVLNVVMGFLILQQVDLIAQLLNATTGYQTETLTQHLNATVSAIQSASFTSGVANLSIILLLVHDMK